MEPKNKEEPRTTKFSEHCFLTLLNIRTGSVRVNMVTKAYVDEAVERIARTGNKDLHWIVDIDTGDSSDSRHYGTINEPSFMVMVKGILDNSPLDPDQSLTTVIQKFGLVGPEWEKFY